MTGNTFIFLSDIHIGINDETSWYQKSIHEKYLKAILRYVQSNAQRIQDFVILGDWFDLWTYPPTKRPPQLQDIFDANPNVFTPRHDGDFITCMNSIQGNLCFVNGNHDMMVSCKEINAHFTEYSAKGTKVICGAMPRENLIYTSGDIYAAHGHDPYSLLCRPDDEDSHYGSLPLGYFISRTVGLICEQKLQEQHKANAALLPDSGNPVFSFEAAAYGLENLEEYLHGEESFAQALLFSLVDPALRPGQKRQDIIYTMYDGSTITAPQAAEVFPNLTVHNADDFQALVNDATNTLSTPAAKLRQNGHKVVILGHTHVPDMIVAGLGKRRGVYANSGFNCPDLPGMQDGKLFPTFVEVEQTDRSYTVCLQKVDYSNETISTLDTKKV